MSPAELLQRFARGGFEQLLNTEPAELADQLEQRAAQTGQSGSLFLSEAIRAVYGLLRAHDESGGIRLGFVHELDEIVRERVPVILRSEPHWAAKLAKDFRDEILTMVRDYDPKNTYD